MNLYLVVASGHWVDEARLVSQNYSAVASGKFIPQSANSAPVL